MYLDDHNTVFTSLCIGDEYRDRIAIQLQSIIKFTAHEAYIITDKPEYFGNYYGPRIHFVQFDESLTTMPLRGKMGMFNYNLKMVPIQYAMAKSQASVTVYLDADTFLFGWDRLFYRFFSLESEGIWGRFRHALNDSDSHKIILDKLEKMGIDGSNIETRLPIENVMFFKNGPTMPAFFDEWTRLANHSYECGARSDFEAIEMALAIHQTKLHYQHIDNAFPHVDNFRTLHHSKIHIPFII